MSKSQDFGQVDLSVGTDNYGRVTTDSNIVLSEDAAVRLNLLLGTEEVPDRGFSDRKRLARRSQVSSA